MDITNLFTLQDQYNYQRDVNWKSNWHNYDFSFALMIAISELLNCYPWRWWEPNCPIYTEAVYDLLRIILGLALSGEILQRTKRPWLPCSHKCVIQLLPFDPLDSHSAMFNFYQLYRAADTMNFEWIIMIACSALENT